jgi:hypothetical protein
MHFSPSALVYVKSLVMLHNYASNFEEISWIDMCNAIMMKQGRAFRLSTFECYSCVLGDLLLVEVVSRCPLVCAPRKEVGCIYWFAHLGRRSAAFIGLRTSEGGRLHIMVCASRKGIAAFVVN